MNYKTIIAFLGKNQMKDWTTPKSKWIHAKDDISTPRWNDEFFKTYLPYMGTKINSIDCDFRFKDYEILSELEALTEDDYQIISGLYFDSRAYLYPTPGCDLYINTDLKIAVVVSPPSPLPQASIDNALNYIAEHNPKQNIDEDEFQKILNGEIT